MGGATNNLEKCFQNGNELGSHLHCPQCNSTSVWKDGHRLSNSKPFQRFICRSCGYRFSEPASRSNPVKDDIQSVATPRAEGEDTNIQSSAVSTRPVCADEAKNLVATETIGTEVAGETPPYKSLLFNYSWYLKKQGFAETTIKGRESLLGVLAKRGTNLLDPEDVKKRHLRTKMVQQTKSERR